jgi:hypothetical protein
MRRLADNTTETFELILYDLEFHPTYSGDGVIVYQYKDIRNGAGPGRNDTPYCTIGIGNLDDSDGLEYTYWNTYHPGAMEIQNEMAIKFITATEYSTGVLSGVVTGHRSNQPIQDAQITTSRGFWAETDENGEFIMEDVYTGENYFFTITAAGYNDSTLTGEDGEGYAINEGDTTEIEVSLLHPEFILSVDEFQAEAEIDQQLDLDFTLTNEGNGQLVWRGEMQNLGDANAEPWELREQINVGEITGDARIYGTVFIDGIYYVAGSNNRDPQIYILSREGELIDQFDQPGVEEEGYGYKDLAFDGELIWGGYRENIYGFTPEGELSATLRGPFDPNNNFVWDPDSELLWVSSTTSNIVGMNREGEMIAELDRQGLRHYGLAYWPFDPDGFNLYIFNKDRDIGDQIITKMNTENGDTMHVAILEPEGGGTPSAAFITNQFDVFSWVFLGVSNCGGEDRIDVWQVDTRFDWAIIEPDAGVLETEEVEELNLHLDASSMPDILAEGELHFFHNADDGLEVIPVSFNILGVNERGLHIQLGAGWNIISVNVFPPREMYAGEDAPGPDIILMTDQLRIDEDNHPIIILKDQLGRFYSPSFNFNNIPYWNLTQGYQIYVNEDVELHWAGEPIPPDTDIPLSEDWNMVAYYPDYMLSATLPDITALSSIRDHLLIAKDFCGRFLVLGDFEFSNMPPWQPGQGYMVKVDADIVLNYPPPEDELAFSHPRSSRQNTPGDRDHWSATPTGQNMSVLVTTINGINPFIGSQIAAFNSEGQVIGTGMITNDGMCGLAVWGDDESTDKIDGLQPGETFTLKLWDAKQKRALPLKPITTLKGVGLMYEPNGLTVLDMATETAVPNEFFLSEAYPNPFNASVRLGYGLPEASGVTINVYDISGRLVTTLTNDKLLAGYHFVVWDGSNTASGIYFVRMFAGEFKSVRKVTQVK